MKKERCDRVKKEGVFERRKRRCDWEKKEGVIERKKKGVIERKKKKGVIEGKKRCVWEKKKKVWLREKRRCDWEKKERCDWEKNKRCDWRKKKCDWGKKKGVTEEQKKVRLKKKKGVTGRKKGCDWRKRRVWLKEKRRVWLKKNKSVIEKKNVWLKKKRCDWLRKKRCDWLCKNPRQQCDCSRFSIPDHCKHVCLDACLCPVVCCRWSSSWRLRRATHGLPFRARVYRGCPAWTHRCAPECRMTLRQRANPLSCWVESFCSMMIVFVFVFVFVFVVEVVRNAFGCNWEHLHPFSTGSAVQAFNRTHSQSSQSFHSYHLYHSYHRGFAPNFLRCVGALFQLVILLKDLIEIFLLVVCSVAIRLVHANADLFHFETVDQLWMLSRLSLDITAIFATTCLTSLAVLWALPTVFRVPIFWRNWSIPTRAAVFIMNTVRWRLLTLSSFWRELSWCCPGSLCRFPSARMQGSWLSPSQWSKSRAGVCPWHLPTQLRTCWTPSPLLVFSVFVDTVGDMLCWSRSIRSPLCRTIPCSWHLLISVGNVLWDLQLMIAAQHYRHLVAFFGPNWFHSFTLQDLLTFASSCRAPNVGSHLCLCKL